MIIVFEDLSEKINLSKNQESFKTFLLRSRHLQISLILICHDIKNAIIRKLSFENSFFNNLNAAILMTPKASPFKFLYSIMSQLTDLSKDEIREVVHLSRSFSSYPYVFISSKYILDDQASRIRFDIFDKKIILTSKVLP